MTAVNYWIIDEIKKLEKQTTREGLYSAFKQDPNLALVAYNEPQFPHPPLPTESGITSA